MKQAFLDIYKDKIVRDGADKLLDWLESSSFFQDPASTRHHLAECGGLCAHSVHMYDRLRALVDMEAAYNREFVRPSDESIAIVALLHDVCKCGVYRREPKNVKTYDPDKVAAAQHWQIKHDELGDFIWESVMGYQFDDPMPFGHGSKSVYIVSSFMKLTREEAFAIRYHMSTWQNEDAGDPGKAYEMYELALLLHMADELASFVDEKEEV